MDLQSLSIYNAPYTNCYLHGLIFTNDMHLPYFELILSDYNVISFLTMFIGDFFAITMPDIIWEWSYTSSQWYNMQTHLTNAHRKWLK